MDGLFRLAETPDHLAVGPTDGRMPVSLLDPERAN